MSSNNVQDAIDELYGVARLSDRMDELETNFNQKFNDYWKTLYPVGSIYTSVDSKSPQTIFGGTWVSFGTGRTLVGIDSSQTEFNSVEKTGGEKTHTLTINEMPSHDHQLIGATSINNNSTYYMTSAIKQFLTSGATITLANSINKAGGSQAHNNLQPYITVYMWKRTA